MFWESGRGEDIRLAGTGGHVEAHPPNDACPGREGDIDEVGDVGEHVRCRDLVTRRHEPAFEAALAVGAAVRGEHGHGRLGRAVEFDYAGQCRIDDDVDAELALDRGRDGVDRRQLAVLPDHLSLAALDEVEHDDRERHDGQDRGHGQGDMPGLGGRCQSLSTTLNRISSSVPMNATGRMTPIHLNHGSSSSPMRPGPLLVDPTAASSADARLGDAANPRSAKTAAPTAQVHAHVRNRTISGLRCRERPTVPFGGAIGPGAGQPSQLSGAAGVGIGSTSSGSRRDRPVRDDPLSLRRAWRAHPADRRARAAGGRSTSGR